MKTIETVPSSNRGYSDLTLKSAFYGEEHINPLVRNSKLLIFLCLLFSVTGKPSFVAHANYPRIKILKL